MTPPSRIRISGESSVGSPHPAREVVREAIKRAITDSLLPREDLVRRLAAVLKRPVQPGLVTQLATGQNGGKAVSAEMLMAVCVATGDTRPLEALAAQLGLALVPCGQDGGSVLPTAGAPS